MDYDKSLAAKERVMEFLDYNSLICHFCQIEFQYEQELVHHYKFHSAFICSMCALEFHTEDNLREHMMAAHWEHASNNSSNASEDIQPFNNSEIFIESPLLPSNDL